jgi:hypothetical protein
MSSSSPKRTTNGKVSKIAWSDVEQHMARLSRNSNDIGLLEVLLRREAQMAMLVHASTMVQRVLSESRPDLAIPFRGWRDHLAAQKLGLGPPPERAFRHPQGACDKTHAMYAEKLTREIKQ